jgi:hypothetical protein
MKHMSLVLQRQPERTVTAQLTLRNLMADVLIEGPEGQCAPWLDALEILRGALTYVYAFPAN